MTTLSTHVLDVEQGLPAAGVRVTLVSIAPREHTLAEAETDQNGRIADLPGRSLESGTYRLVFDVAAYHAARGRPAPFLQRVSVEFRLDGTAAHYHVPLLMSKYACTAYRGS